ncbi:cellulose synthase operon protein YhjQ/BcsQ [Pantoea deleyi]|uniref:cellulose synthase operon protein YhjQ/BcsQ n=1 Tax=Pantoea deleyi TaxID=470932 RepID=UPI0026A3614D
MPQIALQGLRGGVGTTSLCAALGWALTALGERVLLIDGSPVSQLGAHFNLPIQATQGWMQALCEGGDWQQCAQRYPQGPDLLPYGQLSASVQAQDAAVAAPLLEALPALRGRYGWILFDLPADSAPWHEKTAAAAGWPALRHHARRQLPPAPEPAILSCDDPVSDQSV